MAAVDVFRMSLDAIYRGLGVPATINGVSGGPVTVIDKTEGVPNPNAGATANPTLIPACAVRVYELEERGVPANLSTLPGALITFNGKTWKVIATLPRPTPAGESQGERYIYLRNP